MGLIRQELRINEEIRARDVRVLGSDGQQLGVLPFREALRLAQEKDLDLVEIAPHATPPVCRIMNYGKFKYEQSKRDREARKRQKVIDVKEIRMTPKIEDHDFEVKTKNAERFLRDGDKVKITVRFRGREIVHSDLARNMLNDLARRLQATCQVERPPRIEGRSMIMILAPRSEGAGRPAVAAQGPGVQARHDDGRATDETGYGRVAASAPAAARVASAATPAAEA